MASPCPRKSLSRVVATSWRYSVLVVSSMSEISCPGLCGRRRGQAGLQDAQENPNPSL